MIRWSRTTVVVLAAGLSAFAGACSDDDSPQAGETLPSGPTTVARTSPDTTDNSPATSQPSETAPSTVAPTTTMSEEDVKAEIEGDYLEVAERNWDLVADPHTRNLQQRVSQVAVKGSPYYHNTIARVRELVNRGEYMYLDDQPINETIVEKIELVGDPPYTEAIVTACHVSNANLVTDPIPASEFPGGTFPDGVETDVAYVGERRGVGASLYEDGVRLTDDGWRLYEYTGNELVGTWEGSEQCGP